MKDDLLRDWARARRAKPADVPDHEATKSTPVSEDDLAGDLAGALAELTAKSRAQIELETAQKWMRFAAAAYRLYSETGEAEWLVDAAEYHHEALEHGASAAPSFLAGARSFLDAERGAVVPPRGDR